MELITDVLPVSSPHTTTTANTPRHLSRKPRMNFFDIANLLDSDGNLQNEMMVFAFAATMLSTIPILLGNEFDINIGLRRRRSLAGPYEDYKQNTVDSVNSPNEQFPSQSAYKTVMTSVPGVYVSQDHELYHGPNHLLDNVLQWSQTVLMDESPFSNLITLLMDAYNSDPRDANRFIISTYKKVKEYWYQ